MPRAPVSQPKPSASGLPHPVAHETTARVAAPGKPPLPNIFWGALGCVSVLAVGFTVLFFVARPESPGVAPATVAVQPARPLPVAAPQVAAPAPSPGPSPDIQPLAPPAQAAPVEPAHPKPAVRPIKVARAPGSAEGSPGSKKKAAKPSADDQAADSSDEGTSAKKAAADSPTGSDKATDQGAADDDQPAPRHRERASDDPDDD
jgi:hypothetical protein